MHLITWLFSHVLFADAFGFLKGKHFIMLHLSIKKLKFVPRSFATTFWHQNGTGTQKIIYLKTV